MHCETEIAEQVRRLRCEERVCRWADSADTGQSSGMTCTGAVQAHSGLTDIWEWWAREEEGDV